MAQINITKGTTPQGSGTGKLGLSFDTNNNLIIIDENGGTTIVGTGQGGLTNIVAELGVGLASALPAIGNIGDSYVTSDTLQIYTVKDAISWTISDLEKSQFVLNTLASPLLYQFDGTDLILLQAIETAQSIIDKIGDGTTINSLYLPSYVDDVVEVVDFAALPVTGETSKIYITLDNSFAYRWTGTAYFQISSTPTYASQAEAEAGVENTKVVTSLRVLQSWVFQISNYVNAALNTASKTIIGAINELLGKFVGVYTDRGEWDASANTFPDAGGSGTAGAILRGDTFTISVSGDTLFAGMVIRALQDIPGQIATNWYIPTYGAGYVDTKIIHIPATQPAIVSGTPNLLTLDCNNRQEAKFDPVATVTGNFTVALSNTTNTEIFSLTQVYTGTVVISFPASFKCPNPSTIGVWDDTAKTLTLSAGTADIVKMSVMLYGTDWVLFVSGPGGGGSGNVTQTKGVTFTESLDVDKDMIYCNKYTQSGVLTLDNTFSNGANSYLYVPILANGDNIDLSAFKIIKNEYANDINSYGLLLYYDGYTVQASLYLIEDLIPPIIMSILPFETLSGFTKAGEIYSGATESAALSSYYRPASTDCIIQFDYLSSDYNYAVMGFLYANTLPTDFTTSFKYGISIDTNNRLSRVINGGSYTNVAPTVTLIPDGINTKIRIRVESDVFYYDYSIDDGVNWSNAQTLGTYAGALYVGVRNVAVKKFANPLHTGLIN